MQDLERQNPVMKDARSLIKNNLSYRTRPEARGPAEAYPSDETQTRTSGVPADPGMGLTGGTPQAKSLEGGVGGALNRTQPRGWWASPGSRVGLVRDAPQAKSSGDDPEDTRSHAQTQTKVTTSGPQNGSAGGAPRVRSEGGTEDTPDSAQRQQTGPQADQTASKRRRSAAPVSTPAIDDAEGNPVLLTTRNAVCVAGGHTPWALVDAGCTHNILAKEYADRVGVQYVVTNTFTTMQYANEASTTELLLRADKIPVTWKSGDGRECTLFLNFHVSPSLRRFECIIGKNGLSRLSRKHGLHTDYDRNTLEMTDSRGEQVIIQMDTTIGEADRQTTTEVFSIEETSSADDAGEGHEPDPAVKEVLDRHPEVFGKVDGRRESKLPFTVKVRFKGRVPAPVPCGHYRLGPQDTEIMAETLDDLLQRGVIEKAPLARHISPCFLTKKNGVDAKGRPKRRFVVDFRRLHEDVVLEPSVLVQLSAEEIAQRLARQKVYSSLDLSEAYYISEVEPESRNFLAFAVPGMGAFRYRRSPMGFNGSASILAENLNFCLGDLQRQFPGELFLYADDISIGTQTKERNLFIVDKVLEALGRYEIRVNPDKVTWVREEITFLGYAISQNRISMKDKAEGVRDRPAPRTKEQVRSFTSFASYFRNHLDSLAQDCEPLYRVQGVRSVFTWGPEQQHAFETVRDKLLSIPDVQPPSNAVNPQYRLFTDASLAGIGAYLEEIVGGRACPLGFFSKALPAGGRAWSTQDRELFGITEAFRHWDPLLRIGHTTVMCDCLPLVESLRRSRIETERGRRAVAKLIGYHARVLHHTGEGNRADFLSRLPEVESMGSSWEPIQIEINTLTEVELQIDTKEWEAAYQQDTRTKDILEVLSDGSADNHPWRSKYEWEGNLLFCRESGGAPRRVYAPKSKEMEVIERVHCEGHTGITKTLVALMGWVFFPRMKQKVMDYVNGCGACARAKPQHATGTVPRPIEIPEHPWDCLSMDICSGLPRVPYSAPAGGLGGTGDYVDSVLTVVDTLSRFCIFTPCNLECTAEDIARLLAQHVVLAQCTPIPTKLVSDRDTRWTARVFRSMMDRLGVRMALTCAGTAQSNGLSENLNKVLSTYLKAFTHAAKTDWPALLSHAARVYNCSWNAALGMSPAEMRFGMAVPMVVEMGKKKHIEAPLEELRIGQAIAMRCAKDSLWVYQDTQISDAPKVLAPELKKGDLVLVDVRALVPPNLAGRNRKVSPRFTGPYVVEDRVNQGSWRIRLPDRSKAHPTIARRFLKLFPTDKYPDRRQEPGEAEDLDQFTVGHIVKHRKQGGRYHFLVRWAHYGRDHDTWEPVESFEDDEGVIRTEALRTYLQDKQIVL